MVVESVACSLEDCLIAQEAGIGRIELVQAIELGGITPSIALIEQCLEGCKLPVMVMIRPRAGGFHYSDYEFAVMMADAERAIRAGAHGLVFGCLQASGEVDRERMSALRKVADGRDAICHRCFDATPDVVRSMETLIDCGMTRILTGGGRKSAMDGLATLREINQIANHRIEIMPGGSVRSDNVQQIIDVVGCNSVHLGPFKKVDDPTAQLHAEMQFGTHPVLDAVEATAVVQAICDQADDS